MNNRPLTEKERNLAHWMLEHGNPEAAELLPQLEIAEATLWRCECGCASFQFKIRDKPDAPPGVHILGDFVFINGKEPAGIFIYSSDGILSGVEVVSYGETVRRLPEPSVLMTNEQHGREVLGKK